MEYSLSLRYDRRKDGKRGNQYRAIDISNCCNKGVYRLFSFFFLLYRTESELCACVCVCVLYIDFSFRLNIEEILGECARTTHK